MPRRTSRPFQPQPAKPKYHTALRTKRGRTQPNSDIDTAHLNRRQLRARIRRDKKFDKRNAPRRVAHRNGFHRARRTKSQSSWLDWASQFIPSAQTALLTTIALAIVFAPVANAQAVNAEPRRTRAHPEPGHNSAFLSSQANSFAIHQSASTSHAGVAYQATVPEVPMPNKPAIPDFSSSHTTRSRIPHKTKTA